VTPQAPQLFGSDCSSTHVPLHNVSPVGHTQPPFEQPWAHPTPQAPQLFGSDCLSTHVPLHIVSPVGHAQLPFEQTKAHATPQSPQLSGSDCIWTHVPLHIVSPLGHTQLPSSHVAPPVQAVTSPHCPFIAQVCTSLRAHRLAPGTHATQPGCPESHSGVTSPPSPAAGTGSGTS
jgi:hypothetical protein